MTEIRSKKELMAKAEVALMGYATTVRDKENIVFMIDYINKVLGCTDMTGEEIYAEATQYLEKNTHIIGMSCSTLLGGECRVLNLIMKDDEDTKFHLDDPDGVFCHVHNYDWPDCSELGYSFFEKTTGGFYHRIA